MTVVEKVQSKVPQLRFPEFNDKWKSVKLKQVLEINYGKDHKGLAEGEIPVYGTGGVMKYVNQYLYDGPSVLIGRKGTIDKPRFVNGKFWTVDTLFYSKIKKGNNPYFAFNLAQRVQWKKYNEATGVPSLNTSGVNGVPVSVPVISEQDRIASFLSTVDKKTSLLKQKHEQLVQYKKGIMQQLFSQQLRFKDDNGQDFPDWNKNRLDYFLERTSDAVEVDKTTKYRQIGIRSHGKGIFHKDPVSGEELGDKRVFWVHTKALVLNIVFAWEHAVAVTSDSEAGMIASHRFPMYVPKNNRVDLDFMGIFFLRPRGKYLLGIASPGGAGRNKTLGQSNFAELKVTLPCLGEQKKIAAFVNSIDQKINLAQQQIEQTQAYKQGLLQQMFV